MKRTFTLLLLAICLVGVPGFFMVPDMASASPQSGQNKIHHILLLSVDGLHEQDLARYVALHPHSALAQLTQLGVTYTNASASKPSDSFPGLLAMVTGGTPR